MFLLYAMGSEEHPHDEIQTDFVCAEVVLSADYDTEEEDMINADSDSSGSNDETQMDSVSAVAPPKPKHTPAGMRLHVPTPT